MRDLQPRELLSETIRAPVNRGRASGNKKGAPRNLSQKDDEEKISFGKEKAS